MAELADIEEVELQYMDQWFSNLVDTLNYDLQQIMSAAGSLTPDNLTTVDTSPIAYLTASMNKLVGTVNANFDMINKQLQEMDSRINRPGG